MVKSSRNSTNTEQFTNSVHRPHQGVQPIKSTTKIRYNDVPTTYSPAPDTKDMKKVRSFKKKTLKLVSLRRRPKLVIVLTYISIFTLGVALGFTPFIKVYIDNCQEDRRIISSLIGTLKRINISIPQFKDFNYSFPRTEEMVALRPTLDINRKVKNGSTISTDLLPFMEEIIDFLKKINKTLPQTEKYVAAQPWMTDMYVKTAYGIGNSDISLSCSGKIKITLINYSGTKADGKTLEKFNKYCEKKSTTTSGSRSCIVSVDRVYGVPFEDKEAFTEIKYKCEHS